MTHAMLSIDSLQGKKMYFASDFHLGVPNQEESRKREQRIIHWLEKIEGEAGAIFLLGDIFDFWFEYKYTIPKGFIRLQGKLAQLRDRGLPIYFFTGNHDMWMFDYFPNELNIPVYYSPQVITVGTQRLLVGHGDGLGPGDHSYKLLKRFFHSPVCQWLFGWIHPNLGIRLANYWSRNSRINNLENDEKFAGEEAEYLWQYCQSVETKTHHDFYIFGHRHLPLDLALQHGSRYINTGEWVHANSYAVYDGSEVRLMTHEG